MLFIISYHIKKYLKKYFHLFLENQTRTFTKAKKGTIQEKKSVRKFSPILILPCILPPIRHIWARSHTGINSPPKCRPETTFISVTMWVSVVPLFLNLLIDELFNIYPPSQYSLITTLYVYPTTY
ncbi:WAP, Kazal, immunoglobulin, Kunitz and NTR domain-containing protein 1 [Platysternon megacephalum]|nr:WAP, Kazal, immunoglobulin, Kunitz and NTR domain-containing protein 1 [Platysternon megacephalum]